MEPWGSKAAAAAAGLKQHLALVDGISHAKVLETYSNWSDEYERYSQTVKYNGPIIAAEEVTRLVAENQWKEVRILDVGAGAGCFGRELSKYGFTNIDALEPSEGMMKVLSDNDYYNFKYLEGVGFGQSSVPHDTYDIVVSTGGMAPGHIPLVGLNDMIHFTKPGGLVVIIMRHEFLETTEAYRGKMEPYMDELERKGLWRKESRTLLPNYYDYKKGLMFVYRIN